MAPGSPALTVPDGVDVVLLDVGGVLVSDYWETILLTPEHGMVDRLGLDRARVEEVGLALWEVYCRRDGTEADYWSDLGRELGMTVPASLPAELDRLVTVAPGARELLASLGERDVRLGVVSNNTAFWFPKQSALLGLETLMAEYSSLREESLAAIEHRMTATNFTFAALAVVGLLLGTGYASSVIGLWMLGVEIAGEIEPWAVALAAVAATAAVAAWERWFYRYFRRQWRAARAVPEPG